MFKQTVQQAVFKKMKQWNKYKAGPIYPFLEVLLLTKEYSQTC